MTRGPPDAACSVLLLSLFLMASWYSLWTCSSSDFCWSPQRIARTASPLSCCLVFFKNRLIPFTLNPLQFLFQPVGVLVFFFFSLCANHKGRFYGRLISSSRRRSDGRGFSPAPFCSILQAGFCGHVISLIHP